MRFRAGLTSSKLTLFSRSGTTSGTMDSEYLFWAEFFFHGEIMPQNRCTRWSILTSCGTRTSAQGVTAGQNHDRTCEPNPRSPVGIQSSVEANMSCPDRRKYEEDADNAKTAWTVSRNDERLKMNASDARTLLEKHIRECTVCQGDEKTDG
jgi:hypothetical protein